MKDPRKMGFFEFVTTQDERSLNTVVAAFLSILSVFMVVYFLTTANNGTPVAIAHRLLFVLSIMILGVFTYPLKRKSWSDPYTVWSIYDGICVLLVIACCIYYIGDLEGWQLRMFRPSRMDTIFGTIMIFLVLDITRRTVGMTMLCVVGFFLLHTSFANYFPGFLKTAPTAWVRIVDILVSEQGIFSEPVQSMASYIILFLLFGTILEESGAGRYFINIAYAIGGRDLQRTVRQHLRQLRVQCGLHRLLYDPADEVDRLLSGGGGSGGSRGLHRRELYAAGDGGGGLCHGPVSEGALYQDRAVWDLARALVLCGIVGLYPF